MTHNLINFNARGTKFRIPFSLLEKKQHTLPYILAKSMIDQTFVVDQLDDSIYLNICPDYIAKVIDFYDLYSDSLNKDFFKECEQNIYLYMDMMYLGILNEENNQKIKTFKPNSLPPKKKLDIEVEINHKYSRVHTTDNKIILVDISQLDQDNWNVLCSILSGIMNDYIIDKNNIHLDVWIGMASKFLHILLSIIRDGLNWYYHYIEQTELEIIFDNDLHKYEYNYDYESPPDNIVWRYDYCNNLDLDTFTNNSDDESFYDFINKCASNIDDIYNGTNNVLEYINKDLDSVRKNISLINKNCENIYEGLMELANNKNSKKNQKIMEYLKKYEMWYEL